MKEYRRRSLLGEAIYPTEPTETPGKRSRIENTTVAKSAVVAERTIKRILGAVRRIEELAPRLRACIEAKEFLEAGRLAFEVRSLLARADRDARRLRGTEESEVLARAL